MVGYERFFAHTFIWIYSTSPKTFVQFSRLLCILYALNETKKILSGTPSIGWNFAPNLPIFHLSFLIFGRKDNDICLNNTLNGQVYRVYILKMKDQLIERQKFELKFFIFMQCKFTTVRKTDVHARVDVNFSLLLELFCFFHVQILHAMQSKP